jgi:hypothetical protein
MLYSCSPNVQVASADVHRKAAELSIARVCKQLHCNRPGVLPSSTCEKDTDRVRHAIYPLQSQAHERSAARVVLCAVQPQECSDPRATLLLDLPIKPSPMLEGPSCQLFGRLTAQACILALLPGRWGHCLAARM